VISLQPPHVTISGLTEMEEVVEPLLADVALRNACEEYGQRVHGKKEAQGRGHSKVTGLSARR